MPLREPRTAADGSGYSAVPAGGVDHGFLQARQAANQTASGRPPSITDLTSTDPLPYVAGTPARQGRLRSPWQNCMTLPEGQVDRYQVLWFSGQKVCRHGSEFPVFRTFMASCVAPARALGHPAWSAMIGQDRPKGEGRHVRSRLGAVARWRWAHR